MWRPPTSFARFAMAQRTTYKRERGKGSATTQPVAVVRVVDVQVQGYVAVVIRPEVLVVILWCIAQLWRHTWRSE